MTERYSRSSTQKPAMTADGCRAPGARSEAVERSRSRYTTEQSALDDERDAEHGARSELEQVPATERSGAMSRDRKAPRINPGGSVR